MDASWIAGEFETGVFTAFDTETTGLEPETERVVEIGAIRFDKKGIIARYNVLINPGKPMPEKASSINGITDAMLTGKPVSALILPDFMSFIKGSILVAHNAPFDLSFLNSELARNRMGKIENKCFDTLSASREIFPRFGKYSLQFLASQLNIRVTDAHRAEDDARVCMELLLCCIRILKGENARETAG